MMRDLHLKMSINVNVEELQGALEINRTRHKVQVTEARQGYLKKAVEAVDAKLRALKAGVVEPLSFDLRVPQDYTSAYDTVIRMLEWSTDETIEMSAGEFRKLVEDEWDWMGAFLLNSAGYSASAAEYANLKGLR